MVRIHGEGSSKLVDRAQELKFARALGLRLNSSIPIYCTFDNGFVAKYLVGEGITLNQMSGILSTSIADSFAKWHKIKDDSKNQTRNPRGIWKTLEEWIDVAETVVPSEKLSPAIIEIARMKRIIQRQYNIDTQPLSLCHNDLNFANILYNKDQDKDNQIFFIDYEYSGWNYPAFDLGNHFCEYGGMGKMDFSKYPSEEHRREFLRRYLSTLHSQREIEENKLNELLAEVEHYSQVSHLVWHLWALVISHTSQHTEGFDYNDYSKIRLEEYMRRKNYNNKLY